MVGRRDPGRDRDRRPRITSIAPVTEQSQYNLLERKKVEKEYARLNADFSYGNTIWSPLASGLLTGKYKDGIPEDSRGALAGYEWLPDRLTDRDAIARVEKLRPIAERLDCSMAQLALAWATKHEMVSSVITGASKVSQVESELRDRRRDPAHHRRGQRGDRGGHRSLTHVVALVATAPDRPAMKWSAMSITANSASAPGSRRSVAPHQVVRTGRGPA